MKNVALLIFILTVLPVGALTLSAAVYLGDDARFTLWVGGRGEALRPGWTSRPEKPVTGPVVTIRNLSFTPAVIRVKPGETVTWVNRDDFAHTATAADGSFDTKTIAPGESAAWTFEKSGELPYFCSPHPFMKGSVIVEE